MIYQSKENTPLLWAHIMEYVLHAVRASKGKVFMVLLLILILEWMEALINFRQKTVYSEAISNFTQDKPTERERVMINFTCVVGSARARDTPAVSYQGDLEIYIQQTLARFVNSLPEDHVEKDNKNVADVYAGSASLRLARAHQL